MVDMVVKVRKVLSLLTPLQFLLQDWLNRWSSPMVVVVPHLLEIIIAVAVVGGMVVFLDALITEFGDWVTVFCIVARPQGAISNWPSKLQS
nr:hypothetical protein [Tanacetum cinerariifolium]